MVRELLVSRTHVCIQVRGFLDLNPSPRRNFKDIFFIDFLDVQDVLTTHVNCDTRKNIFIFEKVENVS